MLEALPDNIDMDVFLALPLEIQEEIRAQAKVDRSVFDSTRSAPRMYLDVCVVFSYCF